MDKEIQQIRDDLANKLENAFSVDKIDQLYLQYFSKKHGIITQLIKDLPKLATDQKKIYGPALNTLQDEFKQKLDEKKKKLIQNSIEDPSIDLTYAEKPLNSGMLHPTTQVIREMNTFFRYYGFSIAEGPEIETAEYNFRKLNLPEDHPATDLQDTLFIKEPDILLTTHASSVEARVLTDYDPPIRVAFPGKVFRNETVNTTNGSFFHHYQGVVVDKGTTIQNLKATLTDFHKFLFGDDVVIRFRYKYYPEVSPGMGTDMICQFCGGNGCNVCKQRGWIEVLGSGMIHYNTLKMCGIDPEEYTGFAFGMGLDRLVMQKFNIPDIRKLYGGGIVYA
ncbi:phenylalanine--tRNA ligase subunit alpha [Patescibacteria group bacterium]|nr:phenylalanine--tRNA ligase subunit alpha [Patescibacteria group bacterium]